MLAEDRDARDHLRPARRDDRIPSGALRFFGAKPVDERILDGLCHRQRHPRDAPRVVADVEDEDEGAAGVDGDVVVGAVDHLDRFDHAPSERDRCDHLRLRDRSAAERRVEKRHLLRTLLEQLEEEVRRAGRRSNGEHVGGQDGPVS